MLLPVKSPLIKILKLFIAFSMLPITSATSNAVIMFFLFMVIYSMRSLLCCVAEPFLKNGKNSVEQ